MKLYNGNFMPFFLRLTNTVDVNDKKEERPEAVYYQPHKSSKQTYHLLDEEEMKRNHEDG